MSATPDIGTTLTNAFTAVVNAIGSIISAIGNAIASNANTIGTVLVFGGLVGLSLSMLYRYMPFVRTLLGRIL